MDPRTLDAHVWSHSVSPWVLGLYGAKEAAAPLRLHASGAGSSGASFRPSDTQGDGAPVWWCSALAERGRVVARELGDAARLDPGEVLHCGGDLGFPAAR